MLFSTNVFLFRFLPAVLGIYYLCPRRFRNPVLLLFSLIFYGWGEPVYLFLMISVILMDYFCGLWISAGKRPKTAMIIGVAANLLILGFFKYAGFLSGGLLKQLPLPIGISFYIFQSMSYLIDLYRGQAAVQKNALTFGTYVTMFPQLIAGPIVRYTEVAQQLSDRRESIEVFESGVRMFVIGLSKKMLLANPMGNAWELLQQQSGTLAAWMGLAAYTLQIYFDFSGYSDMAIGLGRMFGFEFPVNFRYPYISASVTEFWRRWHISLSSWFREYVYIPLGGNRLGLKRQILNMAIVWLLTGLWHGASWNFVLWGGYYALLLIAEKAFLLRAMKKLPPWLCRMYTVICFMLGWALFYFEDLGTLGVFLCRLAAPASSSGAMHIITGYLPLMLIAAFAATPGMQILLKRFENSPILRILRIPVYLILLLLCTAALARQSYNPFIYFRF